MKNHTNIYDIDGELIRAAGDTHEITAKEAQEKIEFYRKKLEELKENDPKSATYASYIKNLSTYLFSLYSKMTAEQIKAEIDSMTTTNDTPAQVEKAINDLKNDIENLEPEVKTQESMLVEGADRPETVMDEYVDFEEVEQ